jgi:hypothetical protein
LFALSKQASQKLGLTVLCSLGIYLRILLQAWAGGEEIALLYIQRLSRLMTAPSKPGFFVS